jgi:chorismate mutase
MSREEGKLTEIRKRIDELDDAIAELLSKRMVYAKQAREEKVRMNLPILDERRGEEVIEKWCERAREHGEGNGYELSEEMMMKMAALIIKYTIKNELKRE